MPLYHTKSCFHIVLLYANMVAFRLNRLPSVLCFLAYDSAKKTWAPALSPKQEVLAPKLTQAMPLAAHTGSYWRRLPPSLNDAYTSLIS